MFRKALPLFMICLGLTLMTTSTKADAKIPASRLAELKKLGIEDPKDLTVWPNQVSNANSDEWIVKNHDELTKMRPRVLVLNFCNDLSAEKGTKIAQDLAAALTEGTRYHGYKDASVPAFIEWQLYKLVDLRDPKPLPKTPDGNSTAYPRKSKTGWNMSYKALYSKDFAKRLGFEDPEHAGEYLTLDQLVDRGIIHELWFLAHDGPAGSPFECTELKPVYDEKFNRIKGKFRPCGNGGDPEEPWHGRSLRISFINANRGIGCNVESQSHAMEWMANTRVIPYFSMYFCEFASFDLDKRFKLPWNSFYDVMGNAGNGIGYLNEKTAIIVDGDKLTKLENYFCIGGNVHFMPNSRGNYDLSNRNPVMSTIEHYRFFDGPDGKDKAEPWTCEKIEPYRALAPDCMGRWLVYWRQNMPGLNNPCLDDKGKPMKNWWPFLYY